MPESRILDAAILGAGPAGVGVGLALRTLGLQNLALVDAGRIGESFRRWPQGMRLITPNFTGNQYGALDLNSVHPSTSPAFTLGTEHPSGAEYAGYLEALAAWGRLSVLTGHRLRRLERRAEGLFALDLGGRILLARNVVWAGGEYGHPRLPGIPGAELGLHNSAVRDWSKLPGRRQVVVGGYESGVDAAFHLAQAGKQVWVLDPAAPWDSKDSDPSVTLSPYTRDRLRVALAGGRVRLLKAAAQAIRARGRGFQVRAGRRWLASDGSPILATGFASSLGLVKDHFHWRQGLAQVRLADDQSTKTPGLYLAGPSLRHRIKGKLLVFCFIYKFRGRFPLVAASIGRRLKVAPAALAHMTRLYKRSGMWLKDLSCCGEDCAC